MAGLQDLTIQRKLTAIIMLISATALLLTGSVYTVYEQATLRNAEAQNLWAQAGIIGSNCRAALAFSESSDAENTLGSLRGQGAIVFACVYTADHEVLAQYRRDEDDEDLEAPPCGEEGWRFEGGRLVAFRQIEHNGEVMGMVHLRSTLDHLQKILARNVSILASLLLVSLAVAYLLTARLQRVVSEPILGLTKTAKEISEKHGYAKCLVKHGHDELGTLIESFNLMVDTIQESQGKLIEENAERRRAEANLANLLNHVEEEVEARTHELRSANEELAREIVDRQQAEQRLRTAKEYAENLIETANAMVIGVDISGNIKVFNQAAERVTGFRRSEVSNKNWFEIIVPKDRYPEVWDVFQHLSAGELPKNFENPILTKGGEERHIAWQNSEVREHGVIVGAISFGLDITERKHMIQELQRAETRFRTVYDSSSDAIMMLDEDGFFDCNMRTLALFGCESKEEFCGFHPAELSPAKQADGCDSTSAANERIRTAERTGSCRFEWLHKRCDTGEVFPAEVFLTTMELDGKQVLQASVRDISERKQTEAELRTAQQRLVESAHRAGMADVASEVLHNVGNILNSVNIATTQMSDMVATSKVSTLAKVSAMLDEHLEDLGSFLNEDPKGKRIPVFLSEVSELLCSDRERLAQILKGLTRNVQLIKDTITTQQSYACVSGIKEFASLAEVIEDAIQINRAALDRHSVQVVCEFEDLPSTQINKHKVMQILVNLINNGEYALSYGREKDKVMRIRLYQQGDEWFRVEVTDNGIGIAEENLTKIFCHGFTTKKNGHGFGLHSSALAAKEMGGSLSVHSDGLDQGATFTLELPWKQIGAKTCKTNVM